MIFYSYSTFYNISSFFFSKPLSHSSEGCGKGRQGKMWCSGENNDKIYHLNGRYLSKVERRFSNREKEWRRRKHHQDRTARPVKVPIRHRTKNGAALFNAKVIYDGLRQRMDGGRTQFLGFEPCLHSTDSKHFRQFPAKSHSSHDQGWMDGRWWRRTVREWDYCHHNNFQLLNMNLNWILSVLWSVSFSDVAHLSLISVQTSLLSLLSSRLISQAIIVGQITNIKTITIKVLKLNNYKK